jgi:polyisoprenoid-binding protein YceI
MLKRVLLLSLLAVTSISAIAAQKYDIDASHTQVTFTWNHFGFSNPSATLEKISGDFELDTADLTKSSISVTLPLAGVHTGVEKLDAHLKTADFFDAEKYPDITFKTTKVEKDGADALKISGDLSIHGVTKPATFKAKINKIGDNMMTGSKSAGFDADTVIKRSDFGITKYVKEGVGDDIHVHITFAANLAK